MNFSKIQNTHFTLDTLTYESNFLVSYLFGIYFAS